jgi:hypothetical protein
MIVDYLKVTIEPTILSDSTLRELHIEVRVSGKEPLYYVKVCRPDDLGAWIDQYFAEALAQVKQHLKEETE